MKKMSALLTALAVVVVAAPAFAGEGHACTASTQECLNKMASYYSNTGWAGLDGDFDKEHGLYTVTSVAAHSPAAEAGLEIGNVIYGINGRKLAKMTEADWAAYEKERVVGASMTYMVKGGDGGGPKEVAVTLIDMPEELVAKKLGGHMKEHAEIASVQ